MFFCNLHRAKSRFDPQGSLFLKSCEVLWAKKISYRETKSLIEEKDAFCIGRIIAFVLKQQFSEKRMTGDTKM